MTDWDPISQATNHFTLAGQRSPGVAEIVGASLKRDYDERRGPGLSGARLVYRGQKLARPVLRITLSSVEDFVAWNAFYSAVLQRPPDGTRPHALDIEHPQLEARGIASVVIEEIGDLVKTKPDGQWTVEIKTIEHRDPDPALVGIDGSAQSTNDALEREIERLDEEVHARTMLLDMGAERLAGAA